MSLLILSCIRFALSLKSIKEKHKTTKPMKQEEEPITGLPENAFRELKPGEVYNPLMSPDKKYSEVNAWSVTWGILMAILFRPQPPIWG